MKRAGRRFINSAELTSRPKPPAGESVKGHRYARFAPQISRTVEFSEAAIRISEDRVNLGQPIGLEGGDAGEAANEGLKVLLMTGLRLFRNGAMMRHSGLIE